jgi:hypothetical protein
MRFNGGRKIREMRRTDVGDGGSDTDFNAGVALLSELALEELVELGVENTVGDELATLGNSSLDSGHFDVPGGWNWGLSTEEGEVEVERVGRCEIL